MSSLKEEEKTFFKESYVTSHHTYYLHTVHAKSVGDFSVPVVTTTKNDCSERWAWNVQRSATEGESFRIVSIFCFDEQIYST